MKQGAAVIQTLAAGQPGSRQTSKHSRDLLDQRL
jgi:hypothetical protein